MLRTSLFALAVLLSGYANAQLPCGISPQSGWRPISPPKVAVHLLKLLPKPNPNPQVFDLSRAYEHMPKHWFAKPNGSLLLCRSIEKPPAPRCDSDGWSFSRVAGKWVAKQEWESMCVE